MQLDSSSIENLVFDYEDSAEGCNPFTLMMNLRNISKYNFEQIKETLSKYQEMVSHRVLAKVFDIRLSRKDGASFILGNEIDLHSPDEDDENNLELIT